MRLRAVAHWREIVVPAALVAIGGLLATWILISRVRDHEAAQSLDQTEARIAEASTSLHGLMHRCELSLHTLAGMVNSHPRAVSDQAFRDFAESMNLDRHLRGARAVFYLPPRDGPRAGAALVSPPSLRGVVEAGWAPTVGCAVAALEWRVEHSESSTRPIVTDMYFSARFMALLEHPAEEVRTVPDAFWALIHPEDVERVQDAVDKHLHAETQLDVECRMLGRIGDYRRFRLRGSAQRDAQGFPVRVSGSLTDITSQRATERQVRLLHSVVVKARDAIALIDARGDQGLDGPIVSVNEAFGEVQADSGPLHR